ncbi:hypothetical protein [Leptospira santarosai]|uniref:hypothetical protein n=1 Tax=Leptospira santarosai TaxID=28183 RepID=UPI0007746492|nr:hypothetical protein [Leptospira santarosai]
MNNRNQKWTYYIPSIANGLSLLLFSFILYQNQFSAKYKERESVQVAVSDVLSIGREPDFLLSKSIYLMKIVEDSLSEQDQFSLASQLKDMFAEEYLIYSKKHIKFIRYSIIDSVFFRKYLKENEYQIVTLGGVIRNYIEQDLKINKYTRFENHEGLLIEKKEDLFQIGDVNYINQFSRVSNLNILIESGCALLGMMDNSKAQGLAASMLSSQFNNLHITGEKIIVYTDGELKHCGTIL